MVNTKLYDGYEGEGQVLFRDESKNELVVWEGYIYVLMGRMFHQGYKMLADFYSREDDDSPWMIHDIKSAINQFESFSLEKTEQDSFTKDFPMVIKEILEFLIAAQNAKQNVYIYKD